jgi:hypothetical protein
MKQKYGLPKLKECSFAIVRFDLRMSKGTQCDVFALVISFFGVWIGNLKIS